MNAPATIRPATALDLFKALDDRDLLMLIDHLADQLSEDLMDCIAPGLAQAFDAIEENRSYLHRYPAGYTATTRDHWQRWNAHRDARLSKLFAMEGVAA